MIRHILRKDWRLLWPMVVGLALLNALRMVVSTTGIGRLNHPSPAVPLPDILRQITLIATALLVVIVVQSDALPGLRQDWLVRPVKRTDLLLSKLAFVVLLIQCPVFIADVVNGLAAGLPAGPVLGASEVQSLQSLFEFILPLFAFATLTRNLMEALAGGLGVALCTALFMTSVLGHTAVTDGAGIAWIVGLQQSAWVLLGAAVILGLQYYRRKTISSRWVCVATLAAALMAEMMPWDRAFAIQERFSSQPAAGSVVQIDADCRWPVCGTGNNPRGRVVHSSFVDTFIAVPITIRGVGGDERLNYDRAAARIVEPDGKTTELGQYTLGGRTFDIEQRIQRLTVSRELSVRLKRESVRLELDYWLTLLRVSARQSLPMNSSQLAGGMGKCITRTDFNASQIEVSCRIAGRPLCPAWSLEGVSFPVGRFVYQNCSPDYSPWLGRLGGEAVTSYRYAFPFRSPDTMQDPLARQKAEVELTSARIVMQQYLPVAHFTRHVVIQDFRLDDVGLK